IVPYFYFFAPKARKASIEYWKNIRPLYGPLKIRLMVLKHFYRFGTLLLDRQYQKLYPHLVFKHEEKGFSNIAKSIEKNTPLILVGAHVGAWEMAIVNLADHNVLNKIKTVQFEFNQVAVPKHQILVNQIDSPIFDIREQLNEGKVVGMLADRPINNSHVLIPFLSKLFPFDTTSFRVAAATNAELAFFFSFKQKDNKYKFICTKPKYYKYDTATNKNDQLILWLKEFSETLEGLLNEHPDQWLNFYPAWSCEPVLLNTHSPNKVSTAS
ncbi:MAG: hypothetical protein NTY22_03685, partial [Proteobacteria bacterium]|nr:hypothetical protein [Pseudomonadota bacterium]